MFALVAGLLTVLLVAAGLTSCSSATNKSVFRIGISAAIDSLNPFVSSSDYSAVVYQYVYPHLTEYDTRTMTLVPSFARSWTRSADGKEWTFALAAGAKWSDGVSLTAADAAFTLNTIVKFQDGPTGGSAGFVSHLKQATAVSDTSLRLTYDAPVSNVLAQMDQLPILPQHIWGKLATGDGKALRTFANGAPMVSGGPFRLVTYTENQIALFDRNPHWWGAAPHIDGFGLQMFANDDAMVTALKTGQLDMIGEATPATAVDTLKHAGLVVTTAPSTGFYDLIINTNPKKEQHHELLNPKVREALEYATDRAQMVHTAWLDHAQPGSTIVAPATGWHDASITALPFSLTKADEILDSLGYRRGADGIRVAAGVPMRYDVIFPTEIDGAGDRMFQILQNDYRRVGIQLTMRKMDSDAATTAINGDDGKYTGFDLAMWDWIPPVDPDFITSVLTCDQWGNNSDSGYCNPEYDRIYALQAQATDEASRRSLVNRLQQIASADRPYIVLTYQDVIEAHDPQWTGLLISPLVGSVNNLSSQSLLNVRRSDG